MTGAVSKPTRIWKAAVAKHNPSLICCWLLATVPFACSTLFWKIANSQQKCSVIFRFQILSCVMPAYIQMFVETQYYFVRASLQCLKKVHLLKYHTFLNAFTSEPSLMIHQNYKTFGAILHRPLRLLTLEYIMLIPLYIIYM